MNWITNYVRPKINSLFSRREVPENLWTKCPECGTMLFHRELAGNLNVCSSCDHHMAITPRERFEALFDGGIFTEVKVPEPRGRPAALPRPEEIPRPDQGRAEGQRRARRHAGGDGRDRPHADRRRGAGFQLHGRVHGHVCRQRDHCRRRAGGEAEAAPGAVFRQRWRADAGRHAEPDADAAHHGGGADAERGRAALHRRADASRPPAG